MIAVRVLAAGRDVADDAGAGLGRRGCYKGAAVAVLVGLAPGSRSSAGRMIRWRSARAAGIMMAVLVRSPSVRIIPGISPGWRCPACWRPRPPCSGWRRRRCCCTWTRSGIVSSGRRSSMFRRIAWRPAACAALADCRANQGNPVMSDDNLAGSAPLLRSVAAERDDVAAAPPVCLYLEVTNRCNLLCETCPRTFEDLEPPADMSWELFTRIVDQVPNVARVVLHGVGEPMLVKALPKMIRYLKDRGTYVLFNTNGTLLNPKKFQEIIDTGLDELRVSLDAADRASYAAIRGKDFFPRIVRDVGEVHRLSAADGGRNAARFAVADRVEGDGRAVAGIRPAGRLDGRAARCICSDWCSTRPASARRAPSFRCLSRRGTTSRRRSRRLQAIGARTWRDAGCVRRDRTGAEPEAGGGRQAVGDVPPALVADVFHRAWPGAAVLHRAVLGARLRELYAGRRDAADIAGDLEQSGVSGLPRRHCWGMRRPRRAGIAGCGGACRQAVESR